MIFSQDEKDAEKDRKLKALLGLADYHWKEFDGNRAQEWKANFALWAALAALVGISSWQNVNLSRGLACSISIFFGWTFLIYWVRWQTGMWRRNFKSTQAAEAELNKVRGIIGEKKVHITEDEHHPGKGLWDYWYVWQNWSRGSQLLFTLGFIVIAGVAIWFRVTPEVPVAQQASKSSAQLLSQPPSQNPEPNTTPCAPLSTPNRIPARP
jgi:hypothetical protein